MTEYKDLIDAKKEEKERAINEVESIFDSYVERTSDIPFKYRIRKEQYLSYKKYEKEISEYISNFGYTFTLIEEKEKQNAKFFIIDICPTNKGRN